MFRPLGVCLSDVFLRCASLQPSAIHIFIALRYCLRFATLRYTYSIVSASFLVLVYRRAVYLPPYDTVFFADRPVDKCQNTCMVTVTVIPSPYLHRHRTAVRRLRYGVQPYDRLTPEHTLGPGELLRKGGLQSVK